MPDGGIQCGRRTDLIELDQRTVLPGCDPVPEGTVIQIYVDVAIKLGCIQCRSPEDDGLPHRRITADLHLPLLLEDCSKGITINHDDLVAIYIRIIVNGQYLSGIIRIGSVTLCPTGVLRQYVAGEYTPARYHRWYRSC